MTTTNVNEIQASYIEDLAGQIEAFAEELDHCSNGVDTEVWDKVAALIPWHEDVGGAKALRELAARLRDV